MKIKYLYLLLVVSLLPAVTIAQTIPVKPTELGVGTFLGETKALRDIPEISAEELQLLKAKFEAKQLNKKLRYRDYPYADVALPKGPDGVWQREMGKSPAGKAPEVVFDGQSTSSYPPDCNGTVGPNHFMQTVNVTYAIYDKSGTKVAGPTNMNQLFNGVSGSNCNDGDPIMLYDDQADRWVACEFSLCGSNDLMLMAVSSTNDPTGTWFAYSFDVANLPDYPKFSVWQDGYYMGDNNSSGNDIYVFEREVMMAGGSNPKFVGFNNAWRPGSVDGFMCVPPVDNDGEHAPAGSPGLFIAMSDDAFNSGNDQLWIYELDVDWTNTSLSTFNRVQQLDVEPFDSNFGNNWTNIKQPGTSQELDAVPQVIMNVPQYRNFGDYQTIVCCHTVDVDATDHAGIRWYELRKTGSQTSWTVRQSGTYAPDAHSRWMGSIMLNANKELGLGYSISSTTVYPGIRYCGQTSTEYNAASGILDYPEEVVHEGTSSQTGVERWGDYSQMSVDPVDGGTFWYTTQYAGGTRKSKIAAFQVGPLLPTVNFSANNLLPCVNESTVAFTSVTTGNPTIYEWQFTPATVTFTNGTSASSPNPRVTFNAFGNYSVTLTVTGEGGTNSFTRSDYISVNEANADFTASAASVVVDNYVTFSDASTCDVSSWQWNFGVDAIPATANTQGPHIVTYSSTGPKTITLTVNGGSTKIKTDYITVIEPSVTMTNTTVAACNGTFSDPGGVSANYGNNQDYTTLFKPGIPGSKLQFNFTSFNLEAQTNCNKDYLKIYNGTSVFSPLIGMYCGTNSPGTITATNDDGALLFVFHSNATVNMAGWLADITCTAIPAPNPLSFTALAESPFQIDLNWTKNTDNNDVMLVWSANGQFGIPANATTYQPGDVLSGGGTVLYCGSNTSFEHSGLTPSTSYFYRAFSFDADHRYSIGIDANATTKLQPTLQVDPLTIHVNAPAGTTTVNIVSNTDWNLVSDQTWCTGVSTGSGNSEIQLNFSENLVTTPRTALITISVEGLPAVNVELIQAGAAPLLSVTPSNRDVTETSGNTTFEVHSNADWQVSSNQTWCSVTSSGNGNGTIQAVFEPNPGVHTRVATINVHVSGLSDVVVTLTQAGAAPLLSVDPGEIHVNAYMGSSEIHVTSNTDWTVVSDSSWCIVTPSGSGNGVITASYPFNPTGIERTATISVTAEGVPVNTVHLIQNHEVQSIPELGTKGFGIYPNPNKGVFSIMVDDLKLPSFVTEVYDAQGQKIIERNCTGKQEYLFDLGKAAAGNYVIRIIAGKDIYSSKLVVTK